MNALTAIYPAPCDLATGWFRDAITAECNALSDFLRQPVADVSETVALLARQTRPIVLLGVGKSGHVAAKLAATFSSLGTAALFVNAAEAAHGDLGAVESRSVVVILSNSGAAERCAPMLTWTPATPPVAIGRRCPPRLWPDSRSRQPRPPWSPSRTRQPLAPLAPSRPTSRS